MEMFFRKIEYWIEGDANQQRKLDAAPWTGEKIQKKTLKHAVFFILSVIVANYFLAYIIGMDAVLKIISDPISENTGGFFAMLLFSVIFYGVYARLREQVCTTICPYGRMQGVLLIKESIVVAYDFIRGEPRGKLKKSEPSGRVPVAGLRLSTAPKKDPCACEDCSGKGNCGANKHLDSILSTIGTTATTLPTSFGDCIDCKLCVAVCPTGIDIRNGTQLECVNCTACMDACDEVMVKIDRPRGLIRYDSLTGIEKGDRNLFTTRVKAYSLVLFVLLGVDTTLLLNRAPLETIILRSPGQLYQEVDQEHISNLYTYQIINKTARKMDLQLRLATPEGQLQFVSNAPTLVKKDTILQGAFFVKMPRSALKKRKTPIVIEVYSGDRKINVITTNFMGPN